MARRVELTPFGKRVKKRLIDKNMTQMELVNMLKCNKQYLYKILTGERSGENYIEKISEILEIDEVV